MLELIVMNEANTKKPVTTDNKPDNLLDAILHPEVDVQAQPVQADISEEDSIQSQVDASTLQDVAEQPEEETSATDAQGQHVQADISTQDSIQPPVVEHTTEAVSTQADVVAAETDVQAQAAQASKSQEVTTQPPVVTSTLEKDTTPLQAETPAADGQLNTPKEGTTQLQVEPSKNEETISQPSLDVDSAPVVLEVIGLTKQYKGRAKPAVENISFKLRKNQFHVFVGANGAGKTTTIKALVGAYANWEGKILINGKENHTTEAKKYIGYIPEHPAFPKGLSAKQYLIVMAMMSGIAKKQATIFADRTLLELNMQKLAKHSPLTFSSGQQKKILLAQALVHNPDILIMDEPAANLDPIARHEFYSLTRYLQQRGKTIFLSSHILAEVGKYANYVTILDGGKIVYSGDLKPGDDLEEIYFQHVRRGSVDTGLGMYEQNVGASFPFSYIGSNLFDPSVEQKQHAPVQQLQNAGADGVAPSQPQNTGTNDAMPQPDNPTNQEKQDKQDKQNESLND